MGSWDGPSRVGGPEMASRILFQTIVVSCLLLLLCCLLALLPLLPMVSIYRPTVLCVCLLLDV